MIPSEEKVHTGQLESSMRVRIVVEYGEFLPAELRDEYKAVPTVREFVFECSGANEEAVKSYAKLKAIRELLKNDEVCEFIKTLELELC